MTLTLLVVGKTDSKLLDELAQHYVKRLPHYLPFELKVLPDIKRSSKLTPELQKQQEGEELLRCLQPSDKVVLLDERGEQLSSKGFAQYIERYMIAGERRLVFIIGGPYGFSATLYERANALLSLSKMTFSHQMVRLFALEQMYRAMTILRGEPYHHD